MLALQPAPWGGEPMNCFLSRFLAAAFLASVLQPNLPAQMAPGPLTKPLASFVDRHTLAGAVVLVANKEKVLAVESVGFADIAAGKPMANNAMFWIASQSKPITATALMILVDEGKVTLDDPIEKHLPEFKELKVTARDTEGRTVLKSPARPVTIRDCLNHTSGMPFKSAAEAPTLDALSLAAGVSSYAKTPLQTEPGTKYQYSNAGINTAGRVIEVVSGMPFEEFLDKRLFQPMGMADTTFWPNDEQVKRLALSYKPNAAKDNLEPVRIGQLRYPLTDRARGPMPAGGLFSTADDMAVFCRMVLNGGTHNGKRLLSEDSVKAMTTRQTPASMKESYGLGWSVGGTTCGHGGAQSTSMNIDFKRGLVTIFMVQHAGFPGDGGQSRGAFEKAAASLVK